jgi:hypothetical protein
MVPTQTEIVNAKIKAIGVNDLTQTIMRARAYYDNLPYPDYGPNGGWPVVNGEQIYPRVIVPLPQIIVDKSATFLMKRPPRFYVKENKAATDFIRRVIEENQIDFKAAARTAGQEGGVWPKFYFDGFDKRNPWKISILSCQEVTPIYAPHNINDLVMVRIQYKYQRADGTEWWYREEWTASEEIHYFELGNGILEDREALEAAREGDAGENQNNGPWRVSSRLANPFGMIPLQQVRNQIDSLTPNGEGDYWKLYGMFDRINVAYDGLDRSNQFASGPVAVFIEADEAPTALSPHSAYSITGPNADVKLLQLESDLIKSLAYTAKLEAFVYSAAGVVNPKLEDVAGLGQLSFAALQLLHGPIIEATDTKRENWGQRGLCVFFQKMLQAASRWDGAKLGYTQTSEVVASWDDYFPLGGVDKQIELANLKAATDMGLPFDIASRWLARIVGVPESELAEFLAKTATDMEARQKLTEAVAMLGQITKGQPASVGNNKPGLAKQAADGGTKGAARKAQ